jgi:hypothetical protein
MFPVGGGREEEEGEEITGTDLDSDTVLMQFIQYVTVGT